MAISRMQQARQMYNQGMMVHDPRQAYGLGGFIKKAVRGVKKIAKSPLGKAALIYAGGMGLGSIGSGLTGMARFAPSNFMGNMGRIGSFGKSLFKAPVDGKGGGFLQSLVRDKEGNFSAGRAGLLGLAGASIALPFLGGGGDDEEEITDVMDPRYQVQRARNFYSGAGDAGVGLDFMPQKKYVNQNFYAADGGRAGYANGQLVTPSGDGSRPGYAGPIDFFKN